jgi:hypothetical protein
MRDLATMSLDEVATYYGAPEGRTPMGVLIDHLYLFTETAKVKVIGDSEWITPVDGGRAYPVVCGDIVMFDTEDGPTDGRCGRKVVAGGTGCPEHNIPDLGECEHGLSKALCAGPSHYPMDM